METPEVFFLHKTTNQFKSYYVVWKRRVYSRGKSLLGGLNRTMQYGNNVGENEDTVEYSV